MARLVSLLLAALAAPAFLSVDAKSINFATAMPVVVVPKPTMSFRLSKGGVVVRPQPKAVTTVAAVAKPVPVVMTRPAVTVMKRPVAMPVYWMGTGKTVRVSVGKGGIRIRKGPAKGPRRMKVPAAVVATGTAAAAAATAGTVAVATRPTTPAPMASAPAPAPVAVPATTEPMPTDAVAKPAAKPGFRTILAAAEAGKLTTLIAAIKAAGLTAPVTDPESVFTVFAPTDDAFAALLKALKTTPAKLLADKALLTKVLQFHLVPGAAVLSTQLKDGMKVSTALAGKDLTIKLVGGKVAVVGGDVTANVVKPDLTAGKSVVHVIDAVLVPK